MMTWGMIWYIIILCLASSSSPWLALFLPLPVWLPSSLSLCQPWHGWVLSSLGWVNSFGPSNLLFLVRPAFLGLALLYLPTLVRLALLGPAIYYPWKTHYPQPCYLPHSVGLAFFSQLLLVWLSSFFSKLSSLQSASLDRLSSSLGRYGYQK